MTLLDDVKAALRPFSDIANKGGDGNKYTLVKVDDVRRAAAVFARLDALGEGLETTAEERAMWSPVDYVKSCPAATNVMWHRIEALCRDIDRLLLQRVENGQ